MPPVLPQLEMDMNKDLQIEHKQTSEIVTYSNNSRTHSRSQVKLIANSILEFGSISPVLTDENSSVICGHRRLLAARKIGLKVIPVIWVEHLTPTQVKTYRLAENQFANNSGMDMNQLITELDYLANTDIDLDLTGFSTKEIDKILGSDWVPSTDDEITPPPEPAIDISRLPDILRGPHRRIAIVADYLNPEAPD